jgi:hypothetical protein
VTHSDGSDGGRPGSGPVALTGVGEFALADKQTPFVTVVVHNPAVVGAAAAQLLFTMVNGDTSSPCDVQLLTHLMAPDPGEITPTVTRVLLSLLSHYLLLDYTPCLFRCPLSLIFGNVLNGLVLVLYAATGYRRGCDWPGTRAL